MKLLYGFAVSMLLLSVTTVRADDPKTYKPDGDGFIRNWLVLGPIAVDAKVDGHDEASCKEFLDKEYFAGQKTAKPAAATKEKVGDADLAWTAVEASDYFVDLAAVAAAAGKDAEHAVYLGTVYVVAPKDVADVKLSIGSDDDSLWTLNGKEVIRVYAGRAVDKDTDKSETLSLKQGVNVLQFVVINGGGPTSACARFLDKDDKTVPDLTISLTPPAN